MGKTKNLIFYSLTDFERELQFGHAPDMLVYHTSLTLYIILSKQAIELHKSFYLPMMLLHKFMMKANLDWFYLYSNTAWRPITMYYNRQGQIKPYFNIMSWNDSLQKLQYLQYKIAESNHTSKIWLK